MIRNLQSYLAATGLNNAGVMLIHRQLHHEAVATLQDALRLIRNSFPSSVVNEENHVPLHLGEYDAALQSAWRRTILPKMPDIQSYVNFSPKKKILIVTDHGNPFVVYDLLLRSANALCAIKIDPLEGFDNSNDSLDRLAIESAFMLYNYAIASTCLSEHDKNL